MIPKAAIKEYLNRPRDSHLWMKRLKKSELLAAINALKPKPQLYAGLRHHQLVSFLLGVGFPQFAFWLDMGTGKTLISLELLRYWWQAGKLRRAIIFIVSDKAFFTWEKQIKRFGIDLPYIFLDGSSAQKWAALEEFGDGLVFVTYPGAVAAVTVGRPPKPGSKSKKKTMVDLGLLAKFSRRVDAVVIDESTRAAGHTSLTFRLVDKLEAPIRYGLAGRPLGRDPTLLWAQHYLIDRGATLGDTLGLFRGALFTESESQWVPKHKRDYIKTYTFDKRKEGVLSKLIRHRSISYAADECIELPPLVHEIEEVNFPQEAQAYYDRAVETIIKSKGNYRAVENVFLRMRQLSSGFLGFKDDETGEKAEVEFAENPKFDRLFELLDEVPPDRKAVIFYEYTYSGRKIAAEAKARGFRPIWLWSGTKNGRADLEAFETDPRCRLAVLQSKVGAYSLDGLQIANYTFFYESPVSPIDREQAERRLLRDGQTRPVFQFDLVVRKSMDRRILTFHKEGEALMKALIRDPKGLA